MVLLYRFYRIFVYHVNLLIILDLYWVARKKRPELLHGVMHATE